MSDDDEIWCEIRIGELEGVLDRHRVSRDTSWADVVAWERVCGALSGVLQLHANNGVVTGLRKLIVPVLEWLGDADRYGLLSLVNAPISATPIQLWNGGHRLSVMRCQGVPSVPGLFVRDDIGSSVGADRVYPLQD